MNEIERIKQLRKLLHEYNHNYYVQNMPCLLYTSPSPRD